MNAVSNTIRPSCDRKASSFGIGRPVPDLRRATSSRIALWPQRAGENTFEGRVDAAEASLSSETWDRILAAA